MSSAINWFEIAVSDMDRALAFYNTILGVEMQAQDTMPGYQGAFFPHEGGTGGMLVQGEGYKPSQEGSLVYLNGGDDLQTVLGRVEGAGGSIATLKTSIGENGHIAFFVDTEGNKVGLHSMKSSTTGRAGGLKCCTWKVPCYSATRIIYLGWHQSLGPAHFAT